MGDKRERLNRRRFLRYVGISSLAATVLSGERAKACQCDAESGVRSILEFLGKIPESILDELPQAIAEINSDPERHLGNFMSDPRSFLAEFSDTRLDYARFQLIAFDLSPEDTEWTKITADPAYPYESGTNIGIAAFGFVEGRVGLLLRDKQSAAPTCGQAHAGPAMPTAFLAAIGGMAMAEGQRVGRRSLLKHASTGLLAILLLAAGDVKLLRAQLAPIIPPPFPPYFDILDPLHQAVCELDCCGEPCYRAFMADPRCYLSEFHDLKLEDTRWQLIAFDLSQQETPWPKVVSDPAYPYEAELELSLEAIGFAGERIGLVLREITSP